MFSQRIHLFPGAVCLIFWLSSSAKGEAAEARLRESGERIEAKAGELLVRLRPAANGIRLVELRDLKWDESLLATNPPPLFTLTFRREGLRN